MILLPCRAVSRRTMMLLSLALVYLVTAIAAAPNEKLVKPNLSPEDYEFLHSLETPRGSLPAGFRYKYVSRDGSIHDSIPGAHGTYFEVAASPRTSATGHYDAALTVSKMIRYMAPDVFSRLAQHASVGVFTAQEKLTIYPEFYSIANGNCGSSCSGSCKHTCTFDGRKYETLAGVGGRRAAILEDNVMCSARDPYRHHDNILIHEFSHTINSQGFSSSQQSQLTRAYNTARQRQTWRLSSYAMSNSAEYWAEGTGTYFNVDHQSSAGGMNECSGSYCTSEPAARYNLYAKDNALYNLLTYVYTYNRPNLSSGLHICP